MVFLFSHYYFLELVGNLKTRRFISETSKEFYEWITQKDLTYSEPNKRIYLNQAIIEFKNEKGITLAYIVNLDPKGFIAISTNTDITPIIAYSFNCNFPMDDDENNILYHMLKSDMELRLEAISKFSYPKMQ